MIVLSANAFNLNKSKMMPCVSVSFGIDSSLVRSNTLSCGSELQSLQTFVNHTQIYSLNLLPNKPFVFTCLQLKPFENTIGKKEIAHCEQFLLFSVFSTLFENFPPFSSKLILFSANCFNLEKSKIFRLGKG